MIVLSSAATFSLSAASAVAGRSDQTKRPMKTTNCCDRSMIRPVCREKNFFPDREGMVKSTQREIPPAKAGQAAEKFCVVRRQAPLKSGPDLEFLPGAKSDYE